MRARLWPIRKAKGERVVLSQFWSASEAFLDECEAFAVDADALLYSNETLLQRSDAAVLREPGKGDADTHENGDGHEV